MRGKQGDYCVPVRACRMATLLSFAGVAFAPHAQAQDVGAPQPVSASEAGQIEAPPPPPPPVIPRPAPVIEIAPRAFGTIAPTSFDVDVLANGARLWAGRLAVGGAYGRASFTQSLSEYAAPCPGAEAKGAKVQSTNLRFAILRMSGRDGGNTFEVSTNFTRPSGSCPADGGQDTIGLTRVVTLSAGAKTQIKGEGGLLVRLTRRTP